VVNKYMDILKNKWVTCIFARYIYPIDLSGGRPWRSSFKSLGTTYPWYASNWNWTHDSFVRIFLSTFKEWILFWI